MRVDMHSDAGGIALRPFK